MVRTIIHIVNVVAAMNLGTRIDKDKVLELPESEFNTSKKSFNGIILRYKSPKCTIELFESGSITCNGSKSIEDAKKSLKRCLTNLKKVGIKTPENPEIKIHNIVSSINFGIPINIEDAAANLKRAIYEPEQFSGIILNMLVPSATLLIFSTGKVVCTGTKTENDMRTAIASLRLTLEEKQLFKE
jgi:transcription initiation factor TFIID TATA-box-binding protein